MKRLYKRPRRRPERCVYRSKDYEAYRSFVAFSNLGMTIAADMMNTALDRKGFMSRILAGPSVPQPERKTITPKLIELLPYRRGFTFSRYIK